MVYSLWSRDLLHAEKLEDRRYDWDSPIGGAVLSLTGHRDVPAQQFPYQAFIPDGML